MGPGITGDKSKVESNAVGAHEGEADNSSEPLVTNSLCFVPPGEPFTALAARGPNSCSAGGAREGDLMPNTPSVGPYPYGGLERSGGPTFQLQFADQIGSDQEFQHT